MALVMMLSICLLYGWIGATVWFDSTARLKRAFRRNPLIAMSALVIFTGVAFAAFVAIKQLTSH